MLTLKNVLSGLFSRSTISARSATPARSRRLRLEWLEERTLLATFTVNSIADPGDGLCTSSECTLREAISDANANVDPDLIEFDIAGPGVHTIRPTSALPDITDPVVIDGYTQSDATPNTLSLGDNALLRIELDGQFAGDADGLVIKAGGGGSAVRGLVINRFARSGVLILTSNANAIEGNFIGTDVTGTAALGNGLDGVLILLGASSNRVGSDGDGVTDAAERNVIAGNVRQGIQISDPGTDSNIVAGNFIGTDVTGTVAMGNESGVFISGGARFNRVGTSADGVADAAERNVISGNVAFGVIVAHSTTQKNVVAGNWIGLDATGGAPLGNGSDGVDLGEGTQFNRIGTNGDGVEDAAEGNVISVNAGHGVRITSSHSNVVAGNLIGTDFAGTADRGNASIGVYIDSGSTNNTIGGVTPLARNVISGNTGDGVQITGSGTTGNVVQGNLIGVDGRSAPTGAVSWWRGEGNADDFFGTNNGTLQGTIGGSTSFATGKVGSAFSFDGVDDFVEIPNSSSLNPATITVEAWWYGVSFGGAGNNALVDKGFTSHTYPYYQYHLGVTGDQRDGQYSFTVSIGGFIHGVDSGPANTYSIGAWNHFVGTYDGEAVRLYRNGVLIGSDTAPSGPIDSYPTSVRIAAFTNCTIPILEGCVLPSLVDEPTIYNRALTATEIQTIYNAGSAGKGGYRALGNGDRGVRITGGATGNLVGSDGDGSNDTAERNVIAGNVFGVGIDGSGTTGNRVAGNYIGTDAGGEAAIPNTAGGVLVHVGASGNTIGGDTAAERNVISGNTGPNQGFGYGVLLDAAGSNVVSGNFIGTNAAGSAALANSGGGINLNSASGNLIGGSTSAARNVVSGNAGDGIFVSGIGSTANLIQGNYIGTNAAGTGALPNARSGISVGFVANDNTIGGTAAGAGNVISGNAEAGIVVVGATGIAILGNSIFSNAGLGIDLDGVTANDAGDPDAGANNGQNFPDITSRTLTAGTLTLEYRVDSATANSLYPLRVEFFRADAAGEEGQTFLGFDTYAAVEATTTKTVAFVPAVAVAADDRIVATATDANGNTSEFTAGCNLVVDTTADVVNTNDGVNSLREAIACSNATPGLDMITFNIPGSGPHTIQPTSALPSVTDSAVLDANTQPGFVGTPIIELNGSLLNGVGGNPAAAGLEITAGGSVVRGFVINRFGQEGIVLRNGDGNMIEGNFLGTNAAGTAALGNIGAGVYIEDSANNTIGGTTPAARNVISGNNGDGIEITGSGAANNIVQGNLIGVDGRSAPAGAVSWWRGAGNADDFFGTNNGTLGTIGGSTSFVTGKVGQAFSFDEDFVEIPNSSSLNPATITVEAWWYGVSFGGCGNDALVDKGFTSHTFPYYQYHLGVTGDQRDGQYNFLVSVGGQIYGADSGPGITYSIGAWNHFVGTYDGETVRLYRDGVLIASDTAPSGPIDSYPTSVRIAAFTNLPGCVLPGLVDEPTIYNRALTATEIQTIYNAGSAGKGGYRSLGNGDRGVRINGGATGNLVGSDGDGSNDTAERNVISGNVFGVGIDGSGTTGNIVAGNYIGTDPSGTASPPLAGTVSWWKADGNASDFVDSNHGTLVNGATFAAGKNGQAFSFDGVNDYVNIPDSPSLRPANVTLDGWFNFGVVQSGTIDLLGKTVGSGLLNSYVIWYDGGALNGTICDANGHETVSYAFTPAIGQWYHIAFAFDDAANLQSLYVDGSLRATATTTRSIAYDTHPFQIGSGIELETQSVFFQGLVDEPALYNRALTASEIAAIYNAGGLNKGGGNTAGGVLVHAGASDNTIGGTAPGAGNTIAFNGVAGVSVTGAASTGNQLRGNSIDANGGLGIDLGPAGFTPNDTGDADTGANDLQNFPVLSSAQIGTTTRVTGSLNSIANTTFTLDFYANSAADPFGFGEGERYLGSTSVLTDASGNANFDVTLSAPTVVGEVITATATDPAGNTSELSGAVASNQPPTANAGGPYMVGEGASVVLDGSGSSDGEQPSSTLVYKWDLDGDNIFGETGPDAARGDETGISPTFSAVGLDGPGSVVVQLRVTDNGGLTSRATTATIEIANVVPVLTLTGTTSGVAGQTLSYSGSFTDPGPDSWTLTVNCGAGGTAGSQTISQALKTFSFTCTYATTGPKTVTANVDDGDPGGIGTATLGVVIDFANLQTGVCCSGNGTALVVGSLPVNDRIHVNPIGNDGSLQVTITNRTNDVVVYQSTFVQPAGGFSRILVFGQAADDHIQIADSIAVPTCVHAGAGDDKVKGGSGDDILLGGEGDDLLVGGNGRDLLIGGIGSDRLVGNTDNDILIAGTTDYDGDDAALCAILAEWTSSRLYATRVQNLIDGTASTDRLNGQFFLNDQTVHDDGVEDILTGSAGQDWVLFNEDGDNGAAKDKVTDLSADEFAKDIDFIGGT